MLKLHTQFECTLTVESHPLTRGSEAGADLKMAVELKGKLRALRLIFKNK